MLARREMPSMFSMNRAAWRAQDGLRGRRRWNGPLAGEDGPAGSQGLADGLDVGVGYMAFGMGAPEEARGLVQGGAVASAGGGGVELFGEHSFSVRDQGPAEGRARFQAKLRHCPKLGLATI
jgi:hypothetical protein